MDENQKVSLLRAIAISSATSPQILSQITPQSRSEAFTTLEQFKTFDGRMPLALSLLQAESHIYSVPNPGGGVGGDTPIDVTASTKLYILGILQIFLKKEYSKLKNESDRHMIRNAILTAARQLIAQSSAAAGISTATGAPQQSNTTTGGVNQDEIRFLAVKIAALLADVAIRDFPQRWTSFVGDIFSPIDQGGLWFNQNYSTLSVENGRSPQAMYSYGPMIGVKIALECLKIITEDCTDGDFNAKVSTSRRNDVLIGLNEVHSQFLPSIFNLLSEQYSAVTTTKQNLNEMKKYLISNGRTVLQMSPEERSMYEDQVRKRDAAGRLTADCLRTIEKFCQSMPAEWMLGKSSTSSTTGDTTTPTDNGTDFIGALLHLMREDVADLQVIAVSCLNNLAHRKLEIEPWFRMITILPSAVSEANDASITEDTLNAAAEGKAIDQTERLVKYLPFHRKLSKMLSILLSGHLAHITTDQDIVNKRGNRFEILSAYLNLLAEMLSHPSAKVCNEQTSTWIIMLRDPQLAKTSSRLLQPYLERVLKAFMTHRVRIRWDDVEEMTHPFANLLEETWDDKIDYESWVAEFRSKANQIFTNISVVEPKLAITVVHEKVKQIFTTYGTGGERDHVDPNTGALTQQSTAVLEFEALSQPLDNIIQGLPPWALDNTKQGDPSYMDPHRVQSRNTVLSCLKELADTIVAWNPPDNWLKFRRIMLFDALKGYWKYEPSTLATGVDGLLTYLGAEDPVLGIGHPTKKFSDDIVSLRKKAGVALVSISKKVPHLLVEWLGQLSERAKTLLSSDTLLPTNKMHLIEFLSCVATAVQDPVARSNFVSDVLSDSLNSLELPINKEAMGSAEGMLNFLGVTQVGSDPKMATDEVFVKQVTANYVKLFSAFNHLLSVGKRCHEAAKKRPNGGLPVDESVLIATPPDSQQNFPDEGAVSLNDLAVNNPFIPLWTRVLPPLIQVLDVLFTIWQPQYQGNLLKNAAQRYVYAISDDEAYLAKNQGSNSGGGVFGEGGTAGSVITGWDRRDMNLCPKWSGWFNELRNTCLQLLGLLCGTRALFAPELSSLYPKFVSVLASPTHLQNMEHRHLTQYMKQFVEYILLSCPSTLYQSHVAPILSPFFEHLHHRLQCTWAPIKGSTNVPTKPLATIDCERAADIALRGGDEWITSCYARAGLFVGDLDAVTSEAAVERSRVEVTRCFSDVLQVALALKGDWALVLANQAKEEGAVKKNDASRNFTAPSSAKPNASGGGPVNADGTPRSKCHLAIEARKSLRIKSLCHFLLLENESIAGFLVLTIIDCLLYPDAYTCRRCVKICHRVLEATAWVDRYTPVLNTMFKATVQATVTEPKWMVGLEWEMINLTRNIYCRLTLGQTLLFGGQGPGMPHSRDVSNSRFEQSKTVDDPLHGGGILCTPSDLPRQVFMSLPGITPEMIMELDKALIEKPAAKEQKDALRDFLRIAAENLQEAEEKGSAMSADGLLGRATASESFLQTVKQRTDVVEALPEKLVTQSMIQKREEKVEDPPALGDLFKLA